MKPKCTEVQTLEAGSLESHEGFLIDCREGLHRADWGARGLQFAVLPWQNCQRENSILSLQSSDHSGIADHYSVGRVSKGSFSIPPTQWPHASHPSSSPHCRANQGPCLRSLCSEGPASGLAESSLLCHNSQGEALTFPNVQYGFKSQFCRLVAPQSSILFRKMGQDYLSQGGLVE